MIRRLMTVLLVLICCFGTSGLAAGGTSSPPPVCGTNLPTNGSQQGGNVVKLEFFVPDPGCWIQGTMKTVNDKGLFKVMSVIGQALAIFGAALGGARSLAKGSLEPGMKALLIAFVCWTAAHNFSSQSGPGWFMGEWGMGAWQTSYVASAQVGQSMLDSSVLQQSSELGKKIGQYFLSVQELNSMKTGFTMLASVTSPDTLNSVYDQVVNKMNLGNQNIPQLAFTNFGWVYFLTLGLFSVFAAIVYASGLMVCLLVVLTPVLFGIFALGHHKIFNNVGIIWITNVISMLIIPIVMAILMSTMLSSPVNSMNNALDQAIAETQGAVSQAQAQMRSCQGILYVACAGLKSAEAIIANNYNSLTDGITSIGVAIVTILTAFTIAMTQLRRLPAAIAQILGGMGGGESSGVHTDFIPGMRPRGGRQNNQVKQETSVKSSSTVNAGTRGNGGPTVTQMPKGPPLPSGGGGMNAINPKMILLQAGVKTAQAAGRQLKPPSK